MIKKYVCILCNGEIVFDIDSDNKYIAKLFSNVKPLYCDKCVKKENDKAKKNKSESIKAELYRKADLPIKLSLLKDQTLEKIPSQKAAVGYLATCKNLNRKTKLPYLYGPTGTGKTKIAIHFAKFCIQEKLITTKYINLPQLMNKMRGNKETLIMNQRLLILDDLGAHVMSNWTLETIYNIIDHRLSFNKPTLITSNVSPFDLMSHLRKTMSDGASTKLCDALIDRILALCMPIEVGGESIRLRDALGN